MKCHSSLVSVFKANLFQKLLGKSPCNFHFRNTKHAHPILLAAHLPQLEEGADPLPEVRLLHAGGEVQPEMPGEDGEEPPDPAEDEVRKPPAGGSAERSGTPHLMVS